MKIETKEQHEHALEAVERMMEHSLVRQLNSVEEAEFEELVTAIQEYEKGFCND